MEQLTPEERYIAESLKRLGALPPREDDIWLLPTADAPFASRRLFALRKLEMETRIGPNPLDVIADAEPVVFETWNDYEQADPKPLVFKILADA